MPKPQPTIGLISNPTKKGGDNLLERLVRSLQASGITPVLDKATAKQLGDDDFSGLKVRELADAVDLVIVLGGDGTLLWVLRKMEARVKPLAAINTGTLGFLTCATSKESEKLVQALLSGAFDISSRSIIKATLRLGGAEPEEFYALNEVNLGRGSNSRVVHIDTSIDDKPLNSYTGDGLIVATPTGSTAYSLSAGGPIVEPSAEVFAITPICPHALANRPIVVSDRGLIKLSVPEQRDDLLMMVDGQLVAEIDCHAEVEICRADFDLPLIQLPGQSFYEVLHRKLGWTGSAVKPSKGNNLI